MSKRPSEAVNDWDKGKRPQGAPSASICPICKRPHLGECRLFTGRCFRCNKEGHQVKDSRMPDRRPPRATPRIFALIEEKDEAHPSVVSDTRATHSFVASNYVTKWNLEFESAHRNYSVMLPSGESLHSSQVVEGDIVCIGGRKLYASLIIVGIKGYDVILGMDWLLRHYATINCRDGVVNFRPPKENEYSYQATTRSGKIPIVSSMETQYRLKSSCKYS
ncbi:uncharacterized protein LOC124913365 [Impatiens glandulifera]|uniref:uncharacterized protein LOC124913365 n=1 Tax=Impatiens glandulifera TaxID=253017 RepID=UPI001FB13BC5|nr:uncharacterized protein LOC124913365 [Impatiens glandulifera]